MSYKLKDMVHIAPIEKERLRAQDYLYQSVDPWSVRGIDPNAAPAGGMRTMSEQEYARMTEAARENGRRSGFSEGYGRAARETAELSALQFETRLNKLFSKMEAARAAAQDKADAVDCYDTDNVRLSYRYHADQLKKLIKQLSEI